MSDPLVSKIKDVLEQGTGTGVIVDLKRMGLRSGLSAHFEGLTENQGPIFSIAPSGLRRQLVAMRLGSFSGPLITQMQQAGPERHEVARALIEQLVARPDATVELAPLQDQANWTVTGQDFLIKILLRNVEVPSGEDAVLRAAADVMVPLMAAMAELIGYDEYESTEFDFEGGVTAGMVMRRERSPRNRLLCLAIHGNKCVACGIVPAEVYGDAGSIIEIHHLERVALLDTPRPYDPRTDLVPLCPNCHRAVHTRQPLPWSPAELKEMMRHGTG
jgi:5-methylcytosine-specific restriction enzyme A